MNTHNKVARIIKAMDMSNGLTMIAAVTEEPSFPNFEMTCTNISPTTSSIMAALARITPSLDFVKPLVPRTVNIVPRLVELSEAPAAKHCKGVALVSLIRTNDSPIGILIPVVATATASQILALRDFKEVDKPPSVF